LEEGKIKGHPASKRPAETKMGVVRTSVIPGARKKKMIEKVMEQRAVFQGQQKNQGRESKSLMKESVRRREGNHKGGLNQGYGGYGL